jgi:hypothetical protein
MSVGNAFSFFHVELRDVEFVPAALKDSDVKRLRATGPRALHLATSAGLVIDSGMHCKQHDASSKLQVWFEFDGFNPITTDASKYPWKWPGYILHTKYKTEWHDRLFNKNMRVSLVKSKLFSDKVVALADVDLYTVVTGPQNFELTLTSKKNRSEAIGLVRFVMIVDQLCSDPEDVRLTSVNLRYVDITGPCRHIVSSIPRLQRRFGMSTLYVSCQLWRSNSRAWYTHHSEFTFEELRGRCNSASSVIVSEWLHTIQDRVTAQEFLGTSINIVLWSVGHQDHVRETAENSPPYQIELGRCTTTVLGNYDPKQFSPLQVTEKVWWNDCMRDNSDGCPIVVAAGFPAVAAAAAEHAVRAKHAPHKYPSYRRRRTGLSVDVGAAQLLPPEIDFSAELTPEASTPHPGWATEKDPCTDSSTDRDIDHDDTTSVLFTLSIQNGPVFAQMEAGALCSSVTGITGTSVIGFPLPRLIDSVPSLQARSGFNVSWLRDRCELVAEQRGYSHGVPSWMVAGRVPHQSLCDQFNWKPAEVVATIAIDKSPKPLLPRSIVGPAAQLHGEIGTQLGIVAGMHSERSMSHTSVDAVDIASGRVDSNYVHAQELRQYLDAVVGVWELYNVDAHRDYNELVGRIQNQGECDIMDGINYTERCLTEVRKAEAIHACKLHTIRSMLQAHEDAIMIVARDQRLAEMERLREAELPLWLP